MGAVHLCVMELKRHGQGGSEPSPAVSAPDQEGVVEDAAVHPDGSVYVILSQRGRAYHHAVGDVMVLTSPGSLTGQAQIIGVERR